MSDAPPIPTAVDPLLGTVIDRRYKLSRRLAAGGFGAIYEAVHLKSGQPVALKLLHREMATDPRVVARFRREGAALTSLRNPHTITAYETGESEGALFIVLELLDGESLYTRFRKSGPMPWQQVVNIMRAVCVSLGEAHGKGIVHRDLKPANIHLEAHRGEPDFVKVLDFGIAKILNGGEQDADLTSAGQMIGTFDYMAPEQMVGAVTAKSDIYTLAVLAYELIAGARPFGDVGGGPTALLAALVTQTPPSLASRAHVPAELDRIIMKCLEREPEARFADVGELAKALEGIKMEAGQKFDTIVTVPVTDDAAAAATDKNAAPMFSAMDGPESAGTQYPEGKHEAVHTGKFAARPDAIPQMRPVSAISHVHPSMTPAHGMAQMQSMQMQHLHVQPQMQMQMQQPMQLQQQMPPPQMTRSQPPPLNPAALRSRLIWVGLIAGLLILALIAAQC